MDRLTGASRTRWAGDPGARRNLDDGVGGVGGGVGLGQDSRSRT
jgi:hypothetical protein